MGFTRKTPAGTYRAQWRDPSGRQRSKTFPTKKQATAYLAEVETSKNRGTYVDIHAGKIRFGAYAKKWLTARNDEITTKARDLSIMRTHVIPRWGKVPLAKIDHSSVQEWITKLAQQRSPATVRECYRLINAVLRNAVRDRLIAFNPCEDVRLPKRRRKDTDERTITRDQFINQLMPHIPDRYRALVALAGGTGLRWGECVGLRWDAVDLGNQSLNVVRVAVEVAGNVTIKAYPKSRAGRRSVPLPDFVVTALRQHRDTYGIGPAGEVFTNEADGPLRRTLFRSRVWRVALVRAGLLGKVTENEDGYIAQWIDTTGHEHLLDVPTERDAITEIVRHAAGGLRFHDLRHCYATWLVSDGVPVNDVQRVMGHEQATTTLQLYTHHSQGADERVRNTFDAFSLPKSDTSPAKEDQ